MYKNVNWIKRGAVAAVAAGLMLGALPGVALAAEVNEPSIDLDSQTAVDVLQKNWTAATNTQLVNGEKFTFALTLNGIEPVGGNPEVNPKGFTDTAKTKNVKLQAQWKDLSNGTNKATKTFSAADLFKDVVFYSPGIYKFNVKEVKGTNPNVAYDETNSYDIWVNVSWTDDYPTEEVLQIKSIKVHKEGSETQKSTAAGEAFDNGSNAFGEDDPFIVKKVVSGEGASTSQHFKFAVEVTGVSGSYDYVLTGTHDGDSKGGTAKAENNELTIECNLAHEEELKIVGLPKDAKVTVSETGAEGYAESYQVKGTSTATTQDVADGAELTATIEKIEGANGVTFTNTKDAAVDTGLVISVLPYVGLGAAAVAGAATLVISRKRRQSEEF